MWLFKLIHEMTASSTRRTIVEEEKTQPRMHYMLKAFKNICVLDMPVVVMEEENEEDPPTYVITGTNIKHGDRPMIEFDFDVEHFKTPDDIWVCSDSGMGMFDLGMFIADENFRGGPSSQRTADIKYSWNHPVPIIENGVKDPIAVCILDMPNRHYTIKARVNSKTFVVIYLRVEP